MNMASAYFADTTNDNFRPTLNSPFVDAGASVNLNFDADYSQRLQGAAVDIGAYELLSTPFDIEYAKLSGQNIDNQNFLSWEIKENKNILYFTLEKSQAGTSFIPLQKIPIEAGQFLYEYIDKNPDKVNSYRLKLTDFEGKEAYTNTVTLYQDKDFCEVFPNPTTGIVHILTSKQDISFSLTNEIGQVLQKGNEVPNILNISYLAQGVYYLRVGEKRIKIVKM